MIKYQGVLLDIDGTLVDSNDAHVSAWFEAIQTCGFYAAREAIHTQIGKGADNLLPYLFPHSFEWQRKDMAKRHDQIFRDKYLDKVLPLEGATNLVKWFHQHGIRSILASSSNRLDIDHYSELLGIRSYLSGSVSGDDVKHSKPNKDIFAAALSEGGFDAEEVLAIGDSPYDIIAAGKCGIKAIGLLSGGFQLNVLQDVQPIAIYRGPADLLQNIDKSAFMQS